MSAYFLRVPPPFGVPMSIRLTLMPAAVAVAVAVSATSGSAETWICSQTELTRLIVSMNGELLIEQPLGAVHYNIIQNNEIALVAEDHQATFDPAINDIVKLISTVMIDKRSSKFTYTTARSGREVQQRTGPCRGYDEGLENSSAIVAPFPSWDSVIAIPPARPSK